MEICVLTSGSCGNCIYVGNEQYSLVIDIGLSKTYFKKTLECFGKNPKDINAILLTHEHNDHIRGVSDVPKTFDIPIYSTCGTWESIKFKRGKYYPENVNFFCCGDVFKVGDMTVESFKISHDASDPVGYKITDEFGKSVGIATDTGYVTDETKKVITGSDVIILESNYDEDILLNGSYPWHLKMRVGGPKGHLSNKNCGMCLANIIKDNTKHVFLAHLSENNNTPRIAFETTRKILLSKGIVVGQDVDIITTKRYEMCKPIII